MSESADSLYRRGAISPKMAKKHELKVLRGTKVERDKEEEFHGRQGMRDQGAGKERGHKVGGNRHIDTKQEMGPKAGVAGKPSKGGAVGKYGQPGVDEINERDTQGPDFPRAGGSTKASKGGRDGVENRGGEGPDEMDARSNQKPNFPREGRGKETGNKRAKGRIPAQGGIYGGGGRSTQ